MSIVDNFYLSDECVEIREGPLNPGKQASKSLLGLGGPSRLSTISSISDSDLQEPAFPKLLPCILAFYSS